MSKKESREKSEAQRIAEGIIEAGELPSGWVVYVAADGEDGKTEVAKASSTSGSETT